MKFYGLGDFYYNAYCITNFFYVFDSYLAYIDLELASNLFIFIFMLLLEGQITHLICGTNFHLPKYNFQ